MRAVLAGALAAALAVGCNTTRVSLRGARHPVMLARRASVPVAPDAQRLHSERWVVMILAFLQLTGELQGNPSDMPARARVREIEVWSVWGSGMAVYFMSRSTGVALRYEDPRPEVSP